MISFFFAFSLSFAKASTTDGRTSDLAVAQRLIQNLVANHQPEIVRRFGEAVQLKFLNGDVQQANGGHDSSGHLVILVYGGISKLPPPMVSYIICHELGHILGEVPLAKIPADQRKSAFDLRDSVEGEADYFAGRCLKKFFSNGQNPTLTALATAKLALEKIMSAHLPWPLPAQAPYPGINPSYPEPACRLLSVVAGTTGAPRPACWYNPSGFGNGFRN